MTPFGFRFVKVFGPKMMSLDEMAGLVFSPQPYPMLPPIYQPVQLKTGIKAGALTGGLLKSAASAGPARSSVAPTKPSTFFMPISHPIMDDTSNSVAPSCRIVGQIM